MRIKLARQLKSLSQTALAFGIGVSPQMVAHFESGRISATNYVEQMSAFLDQPVAFFYAVFDSSVDPVVAFRSLKRARTKVKESVRAKAITAILNVEPKLARSTYEPDLWVKCEGLEPSDAAQAARSWLGLGSGPLKQDLLAILESRGLRTFWYRDSSDSTTGMSLWSRNIPYAFLRSAGQSAERDNWTLAHELGHLLMHHNVDDIESDPKNNLDADAFARAFLLPQGDFTSRIGRRLDLDLLLEIKSIYRVSIQAIVRSLFEYGLISVDQYRFAFKRLNQRNFRVVEPLDRPAQISTFYVHLSETLSASTWSFEEYCHSELAISTELTKELMPPLAITSVLRELAD